MQMSNVPVPYYYNQMSAKERSYIDYMGNLTENIGSKIERNTDEINSAIVNAQVATSKTIYNNAQELKGTLMMGFSGVSSQLQSGVSNISRELGVMGSSMSMGFALLNRAVQQSSKAICDRLDNINNTLENPLFTESRELYNRAALNYNKGLYEEVLEDLQEAIKKNKTDPSSHFLAGQTYLRGISEFSNVINLEASIEALKNAAKYITSDANTYPEVRPMAAEIWFTLGLAYHAKAMDSLHNSNESDYRKLLEEAKTAYSKSWDYSQEMLESLYNLSRCKALFNESDSAIRDLITLMLKDHGYCIKAFLESDFDNKLKDKLYSQLKRELYPEVKPIFDRIQNIKANFKYPYSSGLTQLIETHLIDTFTEDAPPFDMLEASVYFPEILSLLENEQADYINKCKEQERQQQEQIEQQRRQEQRRIEQERREEQEKEEKLEKERIKREENEAYRRIWETKETRLRTIRTAAMLIQIGCLLYLVASGTNEGLTNTGVSIILFGIFSYVFFSSKRDGRDGRTIAMVVIILWSTFCFIAGIYQDNILDRFCFISYAVGNTTSVIMAFIFSKDYL
jgi:tetratricopeptide (TPR) repeat protein